MGIKKKVNKQAHKGLKVKQHNKLGSKKSKKVQNITQNIKQHVQTTSKRPEQFQPKSNVDSSKSKRKNKQKPKQKSNLKNMKDTPRNKRASAQDQIVERKRSASPSSSHHQNKKQKIPPIFPPHIDQLTPHQPTASPATKPTPTNPAASALAALNAQLTSRLAGSQFRYLNEELYTRTGSESLRMFSDSPHLFTDYHSGFVQQTIRWPQRPVDTALTFLSTLPTTNIVADFGCGDAELAKRAKQRVTSLDLVATSPGVIAGDMSSTPLTTGSVHVVVFSLALMGVDYGKCVEEAARVLARGGWLWIAEVKSRFEGLEGGGGIGTMVEEQRGVRWGATKKGRGVKEVVGVKERGLVTVGCELRFKKRW